MSGNQVFKTLTMLLVVCNVTACSQKGFVTAASTDNSTPTNTTTSTTTTKAADMSCLINDADYSVSANVDSFALTGGASVNAGFTLSGLLKLIGINVTYSTGALSMSMNMTAPLYGTTTIANSSGSASSNNFNFSVNAIVSIVSGGLSAWHSTGLYTLTENSMESAFSSLSSALPSRTWSTVISQSLGEDEFIIPVGETAGLQVGDTFNVYKATYVWSGDGASCSNPLSIVVKSKKAIGVATVEQVDYATAVVSIPGPSQAVANYDRLEINQLQKDSSGNDRSTLKYSIKVQAVTQSSNLSFSDGTNSYNVDMTQYVKPQLTTYIDNTFDSEFYFK